MCPIETLLRREIGLDAASIGSSVIQRASRLRMKQLGLPDAEAYCDLLRSSRDERMELIESVVVNETWFFRDRGSFAAFVRLAMQQWLPRQSAGPLRVLSLPCSSGEEPYSLAMALLDAGLRPERFAVDAVDVSARALAKARRAVFGKNSFRGKDLQFRDRHFRHSREGYSLDPRICGCVQFLQENLLSENCLANQPPYDFVFCRNLLIYFDQPTQVKALEKLRLLLAPQGILFVGPAEMPIFTNHGFASLNLPLAFACRKVIPGDKQAWQSRRHSARPVRKTVAPVPLTRVPPRFAEKPSVVNGQSESVAPKPGRLETQPDLATAQKLADAGQLKEAAAICEAYVQHKGPSAPAFYLLGLMYDATGDPRAASYYRKAIYLDPHHYEALWHLALHLERQGDVAGARTCRRRAERAQRRLS